MPIFWCVACCLQSGTCCKCWHTQWAWHWDDTMLCQQHIYNFLFWRLDRLALYIRNSIKAQWCCIFFVIQVCYNKGMQKLVNIISIHMLHQYDETDDLKNTKWRKRRTLQKADPWIPSWNACAKLNIPFESCSTTLVHWLMSSWTCCWELSFWEDMQSNTAVSFSSALLFVFSQSLLPSIH